MRKATESQSGWQRKEDITVNVREKWKKRVSSRLLQTVHCFFILPDIKAPSFLLSERKCYGAIAQFVTHIIWISAPLYFHKSCHSKKDSRETDREGLRGPTKREAKREKKRTRKEVSNVRGGPAGTEGGGLRYETCLIQSEWWWHVHVCVCVHMCLHMSICGTKIFKNQSRAESDKDTDWETRG